MKKEIRSARINARVLPSTLARAKKAAKKGDWTLSELVEESLIYFLEDNLR